MRWRTPLFVVSALVLASGWGWASLQRGRLEEGRFAQRKLVFVEAENRRLSGLLAARQQEETRAHEAVKRSEIEKDVTRLRALPFLQKVKYREIPRADLPKVLQQKLSQQLPDNEFESNGVALTALGLLPTKIDLKKVYLGLLGEQIGAFYDQHSQELFTFSGQSLDNSQNRIILAHELTHALEDQHFHLADLPLETKGNDDRAMAASALVEGDATLVMNRYLLGHLSANVVKNSLAGALTTDVRQLAAAPRFLRETLLFPYLRGQEFCQVLYEHGGWNALADAFKHPPGSTAQILHPDRFLARPNWEPVAVEFGETVVEGQRPTADNVLGEFGVRQLMIAWQQPPDEAVALAAEWSGDRYLVYGNDGANSYVWRTVWTSASAAKRFAAAARSGWVKRYGIEDSGATPGDSKTQTGSVVFECRLRNGRWLNIRQGGCQVTLREAQDSTWANRLKQSSEHSENAADH